jgi:hypothetical protein
VDISQLISGGGLTTIIILCVAIVVIVGVLAFVLNFVGTIFGAVGGVLGLFTDLITGGPAVWCGCLVLAVILLVCGSIGWLLVSTLNTCGTPQAVNLCGLLGG